MAEPLGEGQDHVAHLVGDNLVVRFASGEHSPEQLAREALVLEFVAGLTDLAVPRPAFVDTELGCLAYERVPGVPLIELPEATRTRAARSVGHELGRLLKALHAVEPARVHDLVDRDDRPLDAWLEDARRDYEAVTIPETYRPRVETFLASTPPSRSDGLVFSHNDLGIEHVLVDPISLEVTGIIDWSDAALCDPAYDLGLIFRDLGEDALDGGTLTERVRFYARCALLEDLAYGISSGRREYAAKSLAALPWVFPAKR
jgi:aminoglycoside phosphotransferase (APT) family kinase protein